MPETYGAHETAALFVLLQENRKVPNPELRNDHGIELKPAARTKLNKAGLLVTTESRPLVHELTSAGVAWCEEALAAGLEPPARPGPLVRTSFTVLRLTVAGLHRRGLRLVDVIREDGTEPPVVEGEPRPAPPGEESPADLESMIREAYDALSTKPQDWVRLAKLRPKLNGAEKGEVDQVLLTMAKTGVVHLAPDSDRKSLTDADRAAAIRIGKEDKHLVAIEES
jgi:hypothetical protein